MAKSYVPHAGPIVTRDQARSRMQARFFIGEVCAHNHVSERWTRNGGCCECARVNLTERRRAKGIQPRQPAMSSEQFRIKRNVLNLRWKAKNREALAAKARAYYAANRDDLNEKNKARAKRDHVATLCRARSARHRRRGAEGKHTKSDVEVLYQNQKGKCVNCNAKLGAKYHVDHIVPLIRGGSHWPSNLQLLCAPCNLSKNDLDPVVWAQRNGRLL